MAVLRSHDGAAVTLAKNRRGRPQRRGIPRTIVTTASTRRHWRLRCVHKERVMSQTTPRLETVLLAEDDPAVRRLVNTILQVEGYQVLEATTGPEAQRLSASHAGTIDLLISDLSLAGITGPELAAQLSAARPGLKV